MNPNLYRNRYAQNEEDWLVGGEFEREGRSCCCPHPPRPPFPPEPIRRERGTIIPLASGGTVTLGSIIGGAPGIPAFIGFGNSGSGLTNLTGIIDLSGAVGTATNFAFSMPRRGLITDVTAYFTTSEAAVFLNSTVTVYAQLYQSTGPNNIFTAIPSTNIQLTPSFTGAVGVGEIATGTISGLSIRVSTETRLMMVFYIVSTGTILVNAIEGYASGGIAIA